MILKKSDTHLAVKLGSIIVHADEITEPGAHDFDRIAIRTLVDDPEVQSWLRSFPPAMLPLKRNAR